MHNYRSSRGFTLIEAIFSIIIVSILIAMISVFIQNPLKSYMDISRRVILTDAADAGVRRISRDVHAALPNSLRVLSSGANQCFEFIPTVGGGRYRADFNNAGGGDILDFTAADGSFDVIAANSLPNFATANKYYAVVYNLGILGADAYEAADNTANRAEIKNTSTASKITLVASNLYPLEATNKRFFVIPDYSVVYSCSGNKLLRSTRSMTNLALAAQASCPATGETLVRNVESCSFDYTAAVFQKTGQLIFRLKLNRFAETGKAKDNEALQLYQEVFINNAP